MATTHYSLIDSVRAKLTDAQREFVEVYRGYVREYLSNRYRGTLNDSDINDVVNATMFEVVHHLDKFRPQREHGSFRAWIKAIARNRVADHFRQLRRTPGGIGRGQAGLRDEFADRDIIDPRKSIDVTEQSADRAANTRLCNDALSKLRLRCEETTIQCFIRHRVDKVPAPSVAEELGLEPAAVRKNSQRVHERLRKLLNGRIDELGEAV